MHTTLAEPQQTGCDSSDTACVDSPSGAKRSAAVQTASLENRALNDVRELKALGNSDVADLSKQFEAYTSCAVKHEAILLAITIAFTATSALVIAESMTLAWPSYTAALSIPLRQPLAIALVGVATTVVALVVIYFLLAQLLEKPSLKDMKFHASRFNSKAHNIGNNLSERLNSKDPRSLASVAIGFEEAMLAFESARRSVNVYERMRYWLEFITLIVMIAITTLLLVTQVFLPIYREMLMLAGWFAVTMFIVLQFRSSWPRQAVPSVRSTAKDHSASGDGVTPQGKSVGRQQLRRMPVIELSRMSGVSSRLAVELALCLYYLRGILPDGQQVVIRTQSRPEDRVFLGKHQTKLG